MLVLFFVSVLLSKFYVGKKSDSEVMEERDEEMCSKSYDPIEHFSR